LQNKYYYLFNIRPVMVNKKHSELAKMQPRDRCGRFTSLSSQHNAPPPSRVQDVGSSRRCIAPPPLHMKEVGSSNRRRTAPPPYARRRLHPTTPLWRCGRWLLHLRHAWRRLHPTTPPQPPRATMINVPMSNR
jgi:hypothetical protein